MSAGPSSSSAVSRVSPGGGTLADVLDRVLDKGIVIDAWAAVSLLGIEIVSVQAQVVVASVETYLKYAQAISSVSLPAAETPPQIEVREAAPRSFAGRAQPERIPSEDELIGYLTEHAGGLRLDQIVEHFHAPWKQLEASVSHLVDEHRVRRDEARNLILPVSAKG
jgi:gas vesicle structural protein